MPEILSIILHHGLDSKSLLSAALTCAAWKDASLDSLWRDLPSLFPAMRVLASMKQKALSGNETSWVRREASVDSWDL